MFTMIQFVKSVKQLIYYDWLLLSVILWEEFNTFGNPPNFNAFGNPPNDLVFFISSITVCWIEPIYFKLSSILKTIYIKTQNWKLEHKRVAYKSIKPHR